MEKRDTENLLSENPAKPLPFIEAIIQTTNQRTSSSFHSHKLPTDPIRLPPRRPFCISFISKYISLSNSRALLQVLRIQQIWIKLDGISCQTPLHRPQKGKCAYELLRLK